MSQEGETAVMLAVRGFESESLQLLLEADANLNLQNNVKPVIYVCVIIMLKESIKTLAYFN